MSEPVVSVDGVGLVYRLTHSGGDSIKEFARDWMGGALRSTEFRALEEVSFSVSSGESVAIIGANGAGKSTLLNVIAGSMQPTTGSCRVRGRLSVVLNSGTCFDRELTGIENIHLAGLFLGRSRYEIKTALDEIVAVTGLGDFIYSPLRSYSAGMAARLSFAVSMAWPVDVFVTDESLAVGDAAFVALCTERLRSLRARGQTIIAVSHDAETVQELCDRAIWIDHGRLIADGPAAEILRRYEARASAAE